MTRHHYLRGLMAGLAATIVLSIIMLIKSGMGILPQLNAIAMLSNILGAPGEPAVGWIAHFVIGVVLWGLLFAQLENRLPGSHTMKGIAFGTGAWILMMILVMPIGGAGFFGLQLGIAAPVVTLILHWIFGAVLGSTYATQTLSKIEHRFEHVSSH